MVEMDAPPRFLRDSNATGEGAFEERLHAALATSGGLAAHPRWATTLTAAEFVDVSEQQVSLEVSGPHGPDPTLLRPRT